MADEQAKKEYDPESFERLKEKHKEDLVKLGRLLHEDAWKARRAKHAAEAKIPPEGSVILSAEQGKAWESYQKLGKAEDITKALGDLEAAKGELATGRRERALADVAAAYGGISTRALGKILEHDKLEAEIKEVQEAGETKKVAYVKDASGQTRTLKEHLEAEWPELRPAEPERPKGTPWVDQSSGGKAPKGSDLVAQAVARNRAAAEAPNPLKK